MLTQQRSNLQGQIRAEILFPRKSSSAINSHSLINWASTQIEVKNQRLLRGSLSFPLRAVVSAREAAVVAPALWHPARPVERYPTARHNHMDGGWWVIAEPQLWSTAVAHARAEVLGIGGDCEQRLCGGAEQQVVNHCLVLVGDRGDLGRQREDHVEIADRQQIGLARRQPILRRRALTLWAMAIATRVVSDAAVAAILAAFDMATKGRRAALLDW